LWLLISDKEDSQLPKQANAFIDPGLSGIRGLIPENAHFASA
jgi:hypothetical protein